MNIIKSLIGPIVACLGAALIQSLMVVGADSLSSESMQRFLLVLCFWFYFVAFSDGYVTGRAFKA